MNTVFCRACGTQIQDSDQFCPKCGAGQGQAKATVATPYAGAATINQNPSAPGPSQEEIDALVWEGRFALIEKAGGYKLSKLWSMPPKEILRVRWNLLAFLFGPFYYAKKGMWRKGVTLFFMGLMIYIGGGIILSAMGLSPNILTLVPAGIFCGQANVSYYRRVKEGHQGWW